jgi:hypothetical protein
MSTDRPGLIATPGPSARPSGPGRAGLGRAMRIVDAGPRYFSRSALASPAVTCLLAIPIALDVRPPDPLPGSQRATITAALAGLAVVVVLALAGLCWPPSRRGRWLDCIAAPGAARCRLARFISFMNQLHAIIGSRTTYVVSFPAGYPGVVYFVADLTSAPVPIDVHTMVMNSPQYRTYLAAFRSSVLPRTGAMVTPNLGAAEARYFRDFYPNARVITLTYLERPVYVLLRRS